MAKETIKKGDSYSATFGFCLSFLFEKAKVNQMIKYEKIDGGFRVSIPFELKDLFKSHFKTAKWDSYSKSWKIGPRSLKKLERFIDETSSQVAEIELAKKLEEESDAQHLDLERLNSELRQVEREIKEKKAYLRNIQEKNQRAKEEVKPLLDSLKAELSQLSSEITKEEECKKEQTGEIKEKLKGILSVEALGDALTRMKRVHNQVGSQARNTWDEAQEEVLKIKQALEKIGLASEGVNEIYYASFNRPDRDSLSGFDYDKFWNIVEIE